MRSLRLVLFEMLLLGQLNVLINSTNFKLSAVALKRKAIFAGS